MEDASGEGELVGLEKEYATRIERDGVGEIAGKVG